MKKYATLIIGIIAVIALVIGITASSKSKTVSVADTVINRGEIRIGYIVYPPLLIKDEKTGQLSGISYDIAEAAAAKLNLKTNWVEEVGWGSAIEGLKTKRYDILGTQMWPNSARAREAVFSNASMNSVIYGYVRSNDSRLTDLSKINSDQVTISILDGEMAQFIAKQDFPNAKTNMLPQLSSFAEVYLNVINKKADVAFEEPATANEFLKSNPESIKRLGNTPVRTFGNSFAFARGQESMVSIWNVALTELMAEGMIQKTLQKYNVSNDYTLSK